MISLADPVLDIDDVRFLNPETMPDPELLIDDVRILEGTLRPDPALLTEEALSLTIRTVSEGAGLDALDLGGVVNLAGVEAFDLEGLLFRARGGVFGSDLAGVASRFKGMSRKHFVFGTYDV